MYVPYMKRNMMQDQKWKKKDKKKKKLKKNKKQEK